MAGVLNLGLNVNFIPIFGILAAAIITIIGFLFLDYGRFWTKEFKGSCPVKYYPLAWLTSNIALCIACFYMASLPLAIIGFILLILIVALLRLFIFKKHKIIALIRQ